MGGIEPKGSEAQLQTGLPVLSATERGVLRWSAEMKYSASLALWQVRLPAVTVKSMFALVVGALLV